MPPALIAYYDGNLDPQTVTRLREDLTEAHMHRDGELFLTVFRLTRFAPPPRDFAQVLVDTRKTYPAPALTKWTEAHPEANEEQRPNFPSDFLLAAANSLDKEPLERKPEYYVCVFAFDSVPRRAQYSHTFATFIKSSRGSVEAHTISWLPTSKHIIVGRTQSEPA
jgi:hypothetical protein